MLPAGAPLLALVAATSVMLAAYGYSMVRSATPARLELGVDTGPPRRRSPMTVLLDAVGARFGPGIVRRLSGPRRERLLIRLAMMGEGGIAGMQAYGRRKARLFALFGTGGVLMMMSGSRLGGLTLLVVGYYWADLQVVSRTQVRQQRIERQMADFLDVLAVTVGAGLAFRPALGRVADVTADPLAGELRTTLRQLDLGQSTRSAFVELRDRNRSESLGLFVAAFLQADELGAPLAKTLVTIAEDIRKEASQEARRRAARAAPRVALIVSFFMVPAAIILLATGLYLSAGDGVGNLLDG